MNEITGPKSDDISGRNSLQNTLLFADRQLDFRSNQSESFNLLIQYLRGIGFDLKAIDYQDNEIDFYKVFSRKSPKLIKSLKISWLSPERVNQLSFGNITSHKVINVRTLKPELGGLFDPRIFGPFLNYECYCGKYKGKENKGQTCERCEVLIDKKNLQR